MITKQRIYTEGVQLSDLHVLKSEIDRVRLFHKENIRRLEGIRSQQHIEACKNLSNEINHTILNTLQSMEKLLCALIDHHSTFPDKFKEKMYAYIVTVVKKFAPK